MIRSSRGREQILEEAVAPLACPIHGMGGSGDQRSLKADTNPDAQYYDHDLLAFRSTLNLTPQVRPPVLMSSVAASPADWLHNSPLTSVQFRHHSIVTQHLPNLSMYRHFIGKCISTSCSGFEEQYRHSITSSRPLLHHVLTLQHSDTSISRRCYRGKAGSRHQRRTRRISIG